MSESPHKRHLEIVSLLAGWLASDVLTGYILNIDQISSDRVFQCFISFNRSVDLSIETSTGLA